MLFWRYCKDMQIYFGYSGHAWLHTPKMIVSACRRLQCLTAFNFITHFFLEILHFKESCNFCNREPEFCQIRDWWWNTNYKINFHFGLLPSKTKDKFSLKIQKTLFWGHFGPFLPKLGQKWIFLVKRTANF